MLSSRMFKNLEKVRHERTEGKNDNLLIYRLQYSSDREIVFKLDSNLLVSERFKDGENELVSC